jgi:hypothetical protein
MIIGVRRAHLQALGTQMKTACPHLWFRMSPQVEGDEPSAHFNKGLIDIPGIKGRIRGKIEGTKTTLWTTRSYGSSK